MAVSLVDVEAKLLVVSGYITKAQANNYILTQGTCRNTNNLNNKNINYYRCASSCSWSASGGA